jgi:very-short-patch-repair endonuclease
MAAVLTAGPGAVLSHMSAGELWGVLGSRRRQSLRHAALPIHITSRARSENRPGIRVHRSRTLTRDEVTLRWNIPVTNPSRTLIDLRRVLPEQRFAAALREAEFLGLPLDAAPERDHTRSELERRFLALSRRHRLPQPEVNVRIGRHIVDFVWRQRRLIVEVDGYRAHGTRAAFESDRARDVELRLLGYEVVRLTWRQLNERPGEVADALRRLLRASERA